PKVIKLPKHVARRAAGNARQWPEPLEVMPVARGACDRLSRPTFRHQRLAFRQTADRHIGGESRPRSAALELLQIVGNFDDALPERLAFAALRRRPEERRYVRFRRSVAFNHLDA